MKLNSTDSIRQPPAVLETVDEKFPESRVWPTIGQPTWKGTPRAGSESLREAVECNQQGPKRR